MAKDFGVASKVVTGLVTEFYEKPKSAQQVLTEEQLNFLFDVMTQRNQIASIDQVFAVKTPEAPKAEKPAEAPKQEAPKAPQQQNKPQQNKPQQNKPAKANRKPIQAVTVTITGRFITRKPGLVSAPRNLEIPLWLIRSATQNSAASKDTVNPATGNPYFLIFSFISALHCLLQRICNGF